MIGLAGRDVLNSIELLKDYYKTQKRSKLMLYSTAWEKKQKLFSYPLAYWKGKGKSILQLVGSLMNSSK